jgi:DNA-binding NarL/FixJ family response regulator
METGDTPRTGVAMPRSALLVCDDAQMSFEIAGRLQDAGCEVMGPVPRAAYALLLAAQTPPDLAIVARPPTGRRGARELANELYETWGVRSLIVDDAAADDEPPAAWLAPAEQIAALRRLLKGAEGLL